MMTHSTGLFCGKTMAAFTKPQHRKKEESEKLREERREEREIRSSLLILDLKDGKL